MKKNIITLTLGLMTVIGAGAQERRNWNFTHGWSDETLAKATGRSSRRATTR